MSMGALEVFFRAGAPGRGRHQGLMRHGKVLGKLSRNPLKRSRLLNNLATSLFEHERIETTMARAKELKRFADKVPEDN